MNFSKDGEGLAEAALREEQRRAEERLDGLLVELDQITAWEALAASVELRELLARRRAEVSAAVATLLVTWRRAGGHTRLVLSEAGEPVAAVADEVELTPEPVRPAHVAEGRPVEGLVAEGLVAEGLVAEGSEAAEPIAPALVREPLQGLIRPPPSRPPAPPATNEALVGLKSRFEGGGAFAVPETDPDWPVLLASTLRDLVPARDLEADLQGVLRVVEAWDRWHGLPPEAQRPLAGLVAARLRMLQEAAFPDDRRIGHAFGILSAFMKKARPGFVSGLARTHRPVRDTWEADADAFFERLVDLLPAPPEAAPNVQRKLEGLEILVREIDAAPQEARSAVEAQVRREITAILGMGISARNPRLVRIATPLLGLLEGAELRALRRAVREEQEAVAEEAREDVEEPGPLPADWPWWPRTRGRRAIMVGGSPRETPRARLQRAFDFAELTWMPAEFRRNALQTVRDRVRAGGVDLVLILRSLVGHDADQIILPACREMEIGWVSVEQGYGVARVRQAIERYLDPEEVRRPR